MGVKEVKGPEWRVRGREGRGKGKGREGKGREGKGRDWNERKEGGRVKRMKECPSPSNCFQSKSALDGAGMYHDL